MVDFSKRWLKLRISQGHFKLTVHAAIRMQERCIFEADIRRCGQSATKIVHQSDKDTWKVVGKDLDDNSLTVICAVREGVIIVTVF